MTFQGHHIVWLPGLSYSDGIFLYTECEQNGRLDMDRDLNHSSHMAPPQVDGGIEAEVGRLAKRNMGRKNGDKAYPSDIVLSSWEKLPHCNKVRVDNVSSGTLYAVVRYSDCELPGSM